MSITLVGAIPRYRIYLSCAFYTLSYLLEGGIEVPIALYFMFIEI